MVAAAKQKRQRRGIAKWNQMPKATEKGRSDGPLQSHGAPPLPNRPVPMTPRQFAEELLRRCWSLLKPKGTADCKAFLDEAEKVFAEAMATQAQSRKKSGKK